jgi:division protein CdvB (Snf7/Vps24/ESCRT-III family)
MGEQPLTNLLKDAFKLPDPLKQQLDLALERIDLQLLKLGQAEVRFGQKHKAIFAKVYEAYTKHETTCACGFAYELAETRKILCLIINSKSVFEQIAFRLRAASEIGDVVCSLGSAVEAFGCVKAKLAYFFPEVENTWSEIENLLSGILNDACLNSKITIDFDANKKEANKILTEAATITEQRIKEKFPN